MNERQIYRENKKYEVCRDFSAELSSLVDSHRKKFDSDKSNIQLCSSLFLECLILYYNDSIVGGFDREEIKALIESEMSFLSSWLFRLTNSYEGSLNVDDITALSRKKYRNGAALSHKDQITYLTPGLQEAADHEKYIETAKLIPGICADDV